MDQDRMRLDGTMEDADVSSNDHLTNELSSMTNADKWGKSQSGEIKAPALFVIEPGRGVALSRGSCYCINAAVLCARPGRHIWHDQDCYFVDRLETAYYAPDARWTPAGDPCTECRCLENQTYTCAPKRCAKTFLCPPGQQPRNRRGECCPSYCGNSSVTDLAEKADSPAKPLSSWTASNPIPLRPPSVIQSKTEPSTPVQSTEHQQIHKLSLKPERFPNEDLSPSGPRLRPGCRPWDDTEVHPTNRFPPGSRLVLTRPCRSLLCICARDNRWLCTDHCPPCIRTFESFENLQEIPQPPPPEGCCPECKCQQTSDKTGQVLSKNEFQNKKTGSDGSLYHFYDSGMTIYGSNGDRNRPAAPFASDHGPGYPGSYRVPFRPEFVERYENATHEHIKRTLKLYVLIAGLVLFCIFGFPMILFFSWQLIRRRRKRDRREYRLRLQRKRQKLAEIASSVGKRPGYLINTNTITHSLTSDSPQTSYSQKNDTTPTYESSKEQQSQSTEGPIGEYEEHAERGDTMRTTTFETNETELSVINPPTQAAVHKLPQSVPMTPTTTEYANSYVKHNCKAGPSPTSNGRPRRVRSALKPSPISVGLVHRPSSSSTPYFPEAYHVKIESPKFESGRSQTTVRRTQSSVSNKDRYGKPNARIALNRASTWLGSTRPASSMIGCFSRNSFRRTDQNEPSSGNRSIKLARLRRSNDLANGSSTSSSSTMSEQADIFFGNDSPLFSYPSPPDSAARLPNSTGQDYAPSPYIAPERVSVPRELPMPSPTRTQHHFIHLNRPAVNIRPQAINTSQTNGYEVKDAIYHESTISKTDPEIDPTVSMCDSQTPLLAIHRTDLTETNSTTTLAAALTPDLSQMTSDVSARSDHAFGPATNLVQFTEMTEQVPVEQDRERSDHACETNERTIVIDTGKPRPRSQQPEQPTTTRIKWDKNVDDKNVETTFTWPRSTKQTTAEPVTTTPLSPSNSLNSQPPCL
ncbi:hypothetical protein D915_009493 [Fasciola hepatica]|uniref:VWFC domain-containing protein n=1 Tax=Fasciola hepatica TaxID=6192 RepID=A0A4E0QX61_FASHE|nr:hypothetical protein D915_009493 [Fasciola hepatica]